MRDRVDLVVNDRRAGLFLTQQMGLKGQVGQHLWAVGRDRLYLAFRRQSRLEGVAKRFDEELRRFKQESAYAQLQARYQDAGGENSGNR